MNIMFSLSRKIFLTCSLAITFAVGSHANLTAQSTYDLKPPMQSAMQNGQASQKFVFAVAVIDADGNLELERSFPVQSAAISTSLGTELVLQTYAVKVPYTETVNGKQITKFRTETRTRTVPIKSKGAQGKSKKPPKGMEAYTESVTQNYTVSVPYTEIVNGKPVVKQRQETRSRTFNVTRYRKKKGSKENTEDPADEKEKDDEAESNAEQEEISPEIKSKTIPYFVKIPVTELVDGEPVIKMKFQKRMREVSSESATFTPTPFQESFPLEKVEFVGLDGKPLDSETVKARLVEKSPVVIINDPKDIGPYFNLIMKPDTIFVVEPSVKSIEK